jgi:acyl-CoA thioester hydrolase
MIRHTTTIRVRYADTDKMGIVYNGNYLAFFEVGRTELLRSIGLPYTELEKDGYLLPVLEAHAEFKNPAVYDDLLDINTSYEPEHGPVITLRYDVRRGDDQIATGYTRHSFVHARSWKVARPPALFTNAVQRAIA